MPYPCNQNPTEAFLPSTCNSLNREALKPISLLKTIETLSSILDLRANLGLKTPQKFNLLYYQFVRFYDSQA